MSETYSFRVVRRAGDARSTSDITRDEWLQFVERDAELEIKSADDEDSVVVKWLGQRSEGSPETVTWNQGELSATVEDLPIDHFFTSFVEKLAEIALELQAEMVGEDGETYHVEPDALRVQFSRSKRATSRLQVWLCTPERLLALGVLLFVCGVALGVTAMGIEQLMGARRWFSDLTSGIGFTLCAVSSFPLFGGLCVRWAHGQPVGARRGVAAMVALTGICLIVCSWLIVDQLGPRSGGLGRIRTDWGDWRDQLLGWFSAGVFLASFVPVWFGAMFVFSKQLGIRFNKHETREPRQNGGSSE